MKFGMNLLLWTATIDESLDPVLEKIKGWGFDGVELPIFDMQLETYQKVGKKLDALGLERTAVTVCTETENPISPDAALREAGLNRIKKAVDMCAASGATKLAGPIHSPLGFFTGKGRTDDEWKRAKEVLAKAGDHAQKNNVTLVVEYLNRFECYFVNCAADTAQLCREINHPNVKMMYDTFHAHIEEKNPKQALEACKDQLVHIHISENDRSTPGEGQVRWDETFAAIKSINFNGWLMIEAFGLALPDLAAATRIWRKMFPTEDHLASNGLKFMKSRAGK